MRIPTERIFFILILVVYWLVGTLFATQTPDWQAPDEPAHYNNIAQVAENGCCPVIEVGDWQQDYQSELTSARFHPDLLDNLDTIQYEDHQPPLYYLLMSIPYRLFDGNLQVLRWVSMVLGTISLVFTYLVGKQVFPERPQIALGAMAFVAFIPQHMHTLTTLNNDTLAEGLIAVTLYVTIRYLKGDDVPVWGLGLLVGIGLITKTTTYFLGGIVPLAILLKWYSQDKDRETSTLIKQWAIFLLPAVIIGGLWFVRNFGVYGFPDFLGLGAHDVVVADQPRTAERIAEVSFGEYLAQGIQITFNSFWGQFGWMAVPLTDVLGGWIYRGFLVLIGVSLSGLVLAVFRRSKSTSPETKTVNRNIWIVLGLTLVLAVLAFIYYNTEFLQFQGRYLYPGLIPFALMMVWGLDTWRDLFLGRWEASRWLTVLVFVGLAGLDVYLLQTVLVPNLVY